MSPDPRWHRYWIAFTTILVKEVRRFTRIWIQTVLPPVVTTSLYFLIFGRLIGPHIGEVSGHAYVDFIVPGLILMAVITHSYANVVSSFYSSKFQRFIDELLTAPVPSWVILAGYVGGGVARGMAVGLTVTAVSMLFAEVRFAHPEVALLVFVLTSILFALGGFINAIYANTFDDISVIPTFVLTPLTYLGGVFYALDMLSPFWHGVALLNPVLYMINAFRYGLLGISDIALGTAFTIIGCFILGLAAFSLWLLERGVGLKT